MGIEEGVVRVEVDSRGTCIMVSRVAVDICSIKDSGVLGHKGRQWYKGVVRGGWPVWVYVSSVSSPLLLLVDLERLDLELGNYPQSESVSSR